MRLLTCSLAALVAAAAIAGPASAEVSEIRITKQPSIIYLPVVIMEQQKLIEKHAKEAGLDLKATWLTFTSGGAATDALLSGNVDLVTSGATNMLLLWSRTGGQVKGVSGVAAVPMLLYTRNPDVKTIKDFTDKDRIALPAVKVSIQAVTLQMAAEKAFGPGQEHKLDHLTVSMAHPDGLTALLSGKSEITGHLSSPPFQYQELAHKGMHRVLNSYDVLGGPATFNVVWTTTKFHDENPKIYAAFVAALDDATAQINADKKKAAETYLRISKDKESLDEIVKMLNDPEIKYTTTPNNTMKYVDFMHKVGSIKVKPASWQEMYFPNAQKLSGS